MKQAIKLDQINLGHKKAIVCWVEYLSLFLYALGTNYQNLLDGALYNNDYQKITS
jgi:hypothetical protein